jgi:folate-binding protein YgfZ
MSDQTFWADWPRDFVVARGPDALAYLDSQLSQDVKPLAVGGSVWSLLLQPAGRVDGLLRVTRTADDEFVLDVDGGYGAAMLVRLDRFRIRVKVELELLPWRCVAVRGPDAATAAASAAAAHAGTSAVRSWWADSEAVDLLGPDPQPPEGIAAADRSRLDQARIRAGWPAMGAELTDRTIPGETGPLLDVAVSFTKGCYPGQELVERMNSRGAAAPRLLRRVHASSGDLAADAAVVVDGAEVGVITSAAAADGLALVGRAIEAGTTAEAGGRAIEVTALR